MTDNSITITVLGHRDETKPYGKRITLQDGKLVTHSEASLVDGTAERVTLNSGKPYAQLAELKGHMPVHQALVGGVYDEKLPDTVPLTLSGREVEHGISRTKDKLPWGKGPGMMTVDCDGGGEGDQTPGICAPETRDELKAMLELVAPGITDAFVLANSSSAGLTNVTTGEMLKPKNRWHFHTLTKDARDIPRALEAMHKRLFIAGHGWPYITKRPAILPRTIIDLALRTPHQPIFGSPDLGEGLVRDIDPVEFAEGALYDTRRIPNVTPDEEAAYLAAVEQMKEQVGQDSAEVIEGFRTETVKRTATQLGVPELVAAQYLERREGKCQLLIGDQAVLLDSGEQVTANALLADTDKYHRATCHDPIEWDYGSGKAIIYTDDNPVPLIHSLAHGLNTRYILKQDVEGFIHGMTQLSMQGRRRIWASMAAARLALGPAEEAAVCKEMLPLLGDTNISTVKKELKAAVQAHRATVMAAFMKEQLRETKARAAAEKRLFHWWDELNVNKAVAALQKHLGNPDDADPLMQHSDALVVAREGRPAYVKMDDGSEPPPVLKFHTLKREGMRQVIEDRTIMWSDEGQIPIPWTLSGELMNAAGLGVPHVHGILEHPIVRHDGSILSRSGYDTDTGLFLSVSGESALPEDTSHEAAQNSLAWLRDVFFDGFPFAYEDDADTAVAILLTSIQRALLVEAPGGIIDGSDRGVGKTALAQAIELARTGRGIPAIALPESEEEIEKRLTAVLMEGRAAVLFDNVREGRKISSEALAACCTSTGGYQSRVLGESRTMNSAGRLMPILTGVNVGTKGDFNSRFLVVRLESADGNPESRRHKRELVKWVPAHRPEILRHALTIICAYIAAGAPKVDVKPSRFTSWDRMVRYPILWAGGDDCAGSFAHNKEEDSEHQAEVGLLAALFQWQQANCDQDSGWKAGAVVHVADIHEAFEERHPKTRFAAPALGTTLNRLRDRWLGGYRVSACGTDGHKNARYWRVTRAGRKCEG